jgi:hypothetical protein
VRTIAKASQPFTYLFLPVTVYQVNWSLAVQINENGATLIDVSLEIGFVNPQPYREVWTIHLIQFVHTFVGDIAHCSEVAANVISDVLKCEAEAILPNPFQASCSHEPARIQSRDLLNKCFPASEFTADVALFLDDQHNAVL